MTITVDTGVGGTFADACRECQGLMRQVPAFTSVKTIINGVECTVFPSTDPEKFQLSVMRAITGGKKYVVDTYVI